MEHIQHFDRLSMFQHFLDFQMKNHGFSQAYFSTFVPYPNNFHKKTRIFPDLYQFLIKKPGFSQIYINFWSFLVGYQHFFSYQGLYDELVKLQQDHPLAPLSAAVVARTVEAGDWRLMTGAFHSEMDFNGIFHYKPSILVSIVMIVVSHW